MIRPSTTAAVPLLVAATFAAACGPLRIPGAVRREPADLIVLMPDPGTGATGSATVSSGGSATLLDASREFTLAGHNGGPTRVRMMAEADVRRLFGDVLDTLPPPPERFTLFFRFETDELTDDSRGMVPDVLRALTGRPAPEVSVVGHTDTTGTARSNYALGMKRGVMVRALLVDAGLDPSAIEVTSHGEAVLLVHTPDETYEPRNRRVEITIR